MLGDQLVAVEDDGMESGGQILVCAVLKGRFDLDRPAVLRPFDQLRLAENAVVSDVQFVLGIEADVAVDACALIPPTLGLEAFDVDGEDIRSAVKVGAVGDIEEGLGIGAEGALHQRAVEVELCVDGSALEADEELTVCERFVEQEGFAVPCVVAGAVAVGVEIVG